MLHISSRENSLFKRVKRLAQGIPERRKTENNGINGAPTILEGVHLCQDWLRHCGQPVHAIFDNLHLEHSDELQRLARNIDAKCLISMDHSLLKAISPIASAQGVLFLVLHPVPALPDRIEGGCLWLDQIQDPGNVGTLLRTAAAAGIDQAYLSTGCASAWSPRVLRSAQGAHFVMTLHERVDLIRAYERLEVPLFATALDEQAVPVYEADLSVPCAWVFGNEGQGVAPELLAVAHHRVYIPQVLSVESLNVAVAAGICLFEQRRQQLKH